MKKRIYLIMADENLFHPIFVARVIKATRKEFVITGITKALDTHKEGFLAFIRKQLQLWGVVGFSYIALRSIYHTLFSSLGINKSLSYKAIASVYKIPYFETYDVNSREHLNFLKKFNIDIILCSCGQIFKKDLLSIPKVASINRHGSLLPKYGGMLPVFWAMYFGEKEFGVSIHYMIEKVDQGDILSQKKVSLQRKNSLFGNYIISFKLAVEALLEALKNIEEGKIVGKFHSNKRQYFSSPRQEKVREFKNKGLKTFKFSDIFSRL